MYFMGDQCPILNQMALLLILENVYLGNVKYTEHLKTATVSITATQMSYMY
jgi:hypothetical protein